jgi:SAM-dependent methyltransferase
MMDEIGAYNRERWDALASAGALFSRPYRDLDAESARARLDPEGRLGDVRGKDVLCLASGGGQQSIAFALLGANVTVFDLSAPQLQRDRETAAARGLTIRVEQGDMRDLSRFAAASFDLVWQPYSINFVPDARPVFREVARILRPDGIYCLMVANPFTIGLRAKDWTGSSYPLTRPYLAGAVVAAPDEPWVVGSNDQAPSIPPPREYRHTLGDVVNGLAEHGFVIEHLTEHTHDAPDAPPGSWEHFTTFAPPWFTVWTSYRPELRMHAAPGPT